MFILIPDANSQAHTVKKHETFVYLQLVVETVRDFFFFFFLERVHSERGLAIYTLSIQNASFVLSSALVQTLADFS